MSICVENVTHVFNRGLPNETIAVKEVSMEIIDGEFLSFIGHTGSGKSTLVQHLNALLQPTSGRVVIDGIDLAKKKTRAEVRRQVGMLFQYPEYQLFEDTVAKDIAFAPKNVGVKHEELDTYVKDAMKKVGLDYDEFAEKSPFELSGGQKRRVALAGVLAMKPKALVLDEPMAGLDPQIRAEMLGYLKQLHENGMTIIMVSHSMDDVAELSDRVAVMNHGELLMLDTPEEVFSHYDVLDDIGLGVPQAVDLARRLREGGIEVPRNICKEEQLQNWILQNLR